MSLWKQIWFYSSIFYHGLLIAWSVEAKSFDWPREKLARYPLITIFGPDQKDTFAYVLGVSSKLRSAPDRKKFNFIDLDKPWTTTQSCGLPSRRPGLIHTSSYIMANSEQIRIAVPISFKLKGELEKNHLSQDHLGSLLKISLVKWTLRDKWTILAAQMFPVSYFMNEDSIRDGQVGINYSNIVLTDPIDVPKGTDIRVRIQWSADTLCNEREFKLKIGDQIRLIRNN
jgi:hypothetical protein